MVRAALAAAAGLLIIAAATVPACAISPEEEASLAELCKLNPQATRGIPQTQVTTDGSWWLGYLDQCTNCMTDLAGNTRTICDALAANGLCAAVPHYSFERNPDMNGQLLPDN